MPMFGQPSVARTAGITAMATILVSVGAYFVVRGTSANNNIIQQWESPTFSHGSGAVTGGQLKAYMTSSGSLVMSGALVVKPSTGTGYAKLGGAASALCIKNTAGTAQVITIVSSTVTVRAAVAADNCP